MKDCYKDCHLCIFREKCTNRTNSEKEGNNHGKTKNS